MLGRSLKGYGRQGQPQGTLTRIQSSLGSVLFLVRVRVRLRVRVRVRARVRVKVRVSVLFLSCCPWWLTRDETHLVGVGVRFRVRVS